MKPGKLQNGSNGKVTSDTIKNNAIVAGPYGNNGFADILETSSESGIYKDDYIYNQATDGKPSPVCASMMATQLPIQLLEFTAKAAGKTVLLNWKTAAEFDNDYFDIEHSANSSNWQSIGKVKGINQPGIQQYAFTDQSPNEGNNYYRFKQKDFDGKYSYSPVRLVKFTDEQKLQLMPNPARQYITLKMTLIKKSGIAVFDAVGRNVTSAVDIQTVAQNELKVDISKLSNGYFIVRANRQQASFIKNN